MRKIPKPPGMVNPGGDVVWCEKAQNRPVLPRQGALSVVGLRADGLTIAAVLAELDDPAKLAAWGFGVEAGARVVRVELPGWEGPAGVELAVRPVRADRVYFENGDVRGIFDRAPIAGAHLEVTFSAAFLATNDLSTGVAEAYVRAIGATLGVVHFLRVRRLDLAADVAGWQIKPGDRDGWVKPGRSPVSSWVDLPEPEQVREHGQGQRITGYTIGAGGPILLRVYDKRAELQLRSPEKAEGEEALWRAQGWRGEGPVTRVEFQLRTEALKSFGIESPEGLYGKLDAIWQNLTQRWVRLVVPGSSARLSRCDLDPRWELVRSIQFLHTSLPAARRYFRAGVPLHQALGGVLSYFANNASEEVARVTLPESASEEQARTALEVQVLRYLGATGRAMCEQLVALLGTSKAAVDYLHARSSAALARASSVGGGASPPEARPSSQRRKRPEVELWAA